MADARVSVLLDIESRLGGLDKALGGFKKLSGTVRRVRRRLPLDAGRSKRGPRHHRAGRKTPPKKLRIPLAVFIRTRILNLWPKNLINSLAHTGLFPPPCNLKANFSIIREVGLSPFNECV